MEQVLSSGRADGTPAAIRDCRPDEAEAVLAVWRQAYAEGLSGSAADVLSLLSDGPGFLLVAEAEGAIAGTVIGAFDGWRGNMYRLAVLPRLQRQGIASDLVRAAEARLRGQGCRRITALAVRDHPWASGFWQAAGYGLDESMGRFVRNIG